MKRLTSNLVIYTKTKHKNGCVREPVLKRTTNSNPESYKTTNNHTHVENKKKY